MFFYILPGNLHCKLLNCRPKLEVSIANFSTIVQKMPSLVGHVLFAYYREVSIANFSIVVRKMPSLVGHVFLHITGKYPLQTSQLSSKIFFPSRPCSCCILPGSLHCKLLNCSPENAFLSRPCFFTYYREVFIANFTTVAQKISSLVSHVFFAYYLEVSIANFSYLLSRSKL